MFKIFITKKYTFSEKEMAVIAVLNYLQCSKHQYVSTSIIEIGFHLTGRWLDIRGKDRRLYEGIREGLQLLIKNNIVKVFSQNGDYYVLYDENLSVDPVNEKFVVIYSNEMQKIFQESNKPFAVFRFFVLLMGTLNVKTKEWHMSQDGMAVNWEYSKSTVNGYFTQLEDMKLVYVYRHNKRRTDGTYRKINNSYGRYEDKEKIISEAESYAELIATEEDFKELDRRSIKMRYNSFRKGGKKYENNLPLIIELYSDCVLYNKSLEKNPIDVKGGEHLEPRQELDLSVFNKYLHVDADFQNGNTIEEMLDFSIASDVVAQTRRNERAHEAHKCTL